MYSCADWRIPHDLYIVHTRIISTAGEIRYQIKSNQYVHTIPIQRDTKSCAELHVLYVMVFIVDALINLL